MRGFSSNGLNKCCNLLTLILLVGGQLQVMTVTMIKGDLPVMEITLKSAKKLAFAYIHGLLIGSPRSI
jgi:hypothetical protein